MSPFVAAMILDEEPEHGRGGDEQLEVALLDDATSIPEVDIEDAARARGSASSERRDERG